MSAAYCRFARAVLALAVLAAVPAFSARAEGAEKEATLQDAIKARTDVTMLRAEVDELPADIRRPMRKVVAKGEAKEMEGNILLTKDKYGEAVEAFGSSAALYRQALEGKKLLERLAAAARKANRAKLLAESSAPAEKTREAARLMTNAEGYAEAAEFEAAIAELDKARKAYEALLTPGEAVTLEQVVAARTAMLSARKLVKNVGDFDPGEPGVRVRAPRRPGEKRPGLQEAQEEVPEYPVTEGAGKRAKRGSLPDVLGRARSADLGAAEALEQREYAPALALFQAAEKLYRQAASLQAKRESVLAALKATQESMNLADRAFQTEARPVSFERGKQLLADARKALEEEDLDGAKRLFGAAAESFAKAQGEAEVANQLAKAQEAWGAALAKADEQLLAKHAAEGLAAAKKKAAAAQTQAAAGKSEDARALYQEAVEALASAVAEALTQENLAKAAPVLQRLQAAIAAKEKFAAEDRLAEVEKLIPKDSRLPALRQAVEAVPGLKKSRSPLTWATTSPWTSC